MEGEYQGRKSYHISLGWKDQSKENQRRADLLNKIEVIILDRIGSDQSKQIVLEQYNKTH